MNKIYNKNIKAIITIKILFKIQKNSCMNSDITISLSQQLKPPKTIKIMLDHLVNDFFIFYKNIIKL